jgi:hypothetical protein
VIIVKWFTLSQSKSVFSDPRDGAGYRPRRYRSLNTILIVPVENSNSAILMMQSAKNRVGRSAAVELNCTPEWRIFVQRQVRSRLVVQQGLRTHTGPFFARFFIGIIPGLVAAFAFILPPRPPGRDEIEVDRWMFLEPAIALLVGILIVENDVLRLQRSTFLVYLRSGKLRTQNVLVKAPSLQCT